MTLYHTNMYVFHKLFLGLYKIKIVSLYKIASVGSCVFSLYISVYMKGFLLMENYIRAESGLPSDPGDVWPKCSA